MKVLYTPKKFAGSSLEIIGQAVEIITSYEAQGLNLTLRQLYYQFVARDLLANTQRNYKRLGGIVSDARRAGLIDWYAIVDRTRFVRSDSHWDSPADIINASVRDYKLDHWANQEYRPQVWIEKDALIGLLDDVCSRFDVPYFSCRGYVSDSAIWRAAQTMREHSEYEAKTPVVIHLGDFDPSGSDMSGDIGRRLELFGDGAVEVKRIALNMDQIEKYKPPPNPVKLTDSRVAKYVILFGTNNSWELDALEPSVLIKLINDTIDDLIDHDAWDEVEENQLRDKQQLQAVSENWDKAVAAVSE